MKKLDNEVKAIMKDAAKRLTGFKRRAYQAKIAIATILSWILSYQGVEQLFMPYFFIFQIFSDYNGLRGGSNLLILLHHEIILIDQITIY